MIVRLTLRNLLTDFNVPINEEAFEIALDLSQK